MQRSLIRERLGLERFSARIDKPRSQQLISLPPSSSTDELGSHQVASSMGTSASVLFLSDSMHDYIVGSAAYCDACQRTRALTHTYVSCCGPSCASMTPKLSRSNSLDWRDCALTGGGAEVREEEITSDVEARLRELYSVLVNSSSRHAC